MRPLLALALLLALPLRAEVRRQELPVPPRGQALGGACANCRATAESLWYNPAGLLGGAELQAGTLSWAEGMQVNGIQGAYGNPGLVVGMGMQAFGLKLEERDALGAVTGSIGYDERSTSLGLALGNPRLSAGLALRYLQKSWSGDHLRGEASNSLALDFGVQAAIPATQWRMGAYLRGFSATGRMNGGATGCAYGCLPEAEGIAPEGRFGFEWQPSVKGLSLMAETAYYPDRSAWALSTGAEESLALGAGLQGALRLGWRDDHRFLGSFGGLSGGLGLARQWLQLDYAVSSLGDFGLAHRVALALRLR